MRESRINCPIEQQNKFIKENNYAYIREIRELMAFRKVDPNHYAGLITKGRHELYDYNAGILSIYLCLLEDKEHNTWCVRFCIGCYDDGSWGAFSKEFADKDDACKLLQKVVPIVESWGNVCPSAEEINEEFNKIGLHGIYEG